MLFYIGMIIKLRLSLSHITKITGACKFFFPYRGNGHFSRVAYDIIINVSKSIAHLISIYLQNITKTSDPSTHDAMSCLLF